MDNLDSSIILLIITVLLTSVYILYCILKNPFKYPYYIHEFDITSKRNVKFENYIDDFLCKNYNWNSLQTHEEYIQNWKNETETYINDCKLKKYRTKQYKKILDDSNAYHFKMIKKQTRYKQRNYVKTSYKVTIVVSKKIVNWQWLNERYEKLKAINFESTLINYNSKNQRKLMTQSLRKQIMKRDSYTCQICGKYMPDEVGLHIDHIIPIAKGGKSVYSNLRVLCSKCNGKKGAK